MKPELNKNGFKPVLEWPRQSQALIDEYFVGASSWLASLSLFILFLGSHLNHSILFCRWDVLVQDTQLDNMSYSEVRDQTSM